MPGISLKSTMNKIKIAVLISREMREKCIGEPDFQRLQNLGEVVCSDRDKPSEQLITECMHGADACLTGWGTPPITPAMIDQAPGLKLIAHSAGSVKAILASIREQILQRNILVASAVSSLGIGVAEFTLGMMLMTMKRAWRFNDLARHGQWREKEEISRMKEPYQAVIGVVAASHVGRHLIKLLKNFDVRILVYDPYLSAEDAGQLGAVKVPLDELFRSSDVVTIHAPSTEETRHMIRAEYLRMMKNNAILINTARGALIKEDDLIAELRTGRITACLDVTDPEPPAASSPLRTLPNVILTPHIAGSVANNCLRNGKFAVDDIENYFHNGNILHPVNIKLWDRLA